MGGSDCNRIAGQIRGALERRQPFTLPLMTAADLGRVLACLRAASDADRAKRQGANQ